MRINIITNWQDQKGLWRDGLLLGANLKAWGYEVAEVQFNSRFALPPRGSKAGLNIFLETLRPEFFPLAPRQWWVPHLEWADEDSLAAVPALDQILCKTRDAFYALRPYHQCVSYVGWESTDMYDASVLRIWSALHVAGGNALKGTQIVLDTWERYSPEIPLTVVGEEQIVKPRIIPNVTYRLGRLSEEELKTLQNQSKIHLCPSEFEGWGHTIYEGISVDAHVITSYHAKGAVTLRSKPHGKRCLATLVKVDPADLDKYLRYCTSRGRIMPLIEGLGPRDQFLLERQAFRARLKRLLLNEKLKPF